MQSKSKYTIAGAAATVLTLTAVWSIYNLLSGFTFMSPEDCNIYKAVAFSLILWNSLGFMVRIFQWAEKHENSTTQL